jgi:hypothetical protein
MLTKRVRNPSRKGGTVAGFLNRLKPAWKRRKGAPSVEPVYGTYHRYTQNEKNIVHNINIILNWFIELL